MKIVIDRNIPYALEALAPYGEVVALPGGEISRSDLADADALITRTRTRCNSSLLDGTPVKFIATATIGTDHIDLPYCASRGITVANAPGCNAPAVAQWVLAAIREWLPEGEGFEDKTLGVIGAGHVGSVLIRWARSLGMNVLVNDPPRELAEGVAPQYNYVSLDRIAREADIVTVHPPLTTAGSHPTYHLINSDFVGSLLRRPLLLNAARGPVASTDALIAGLDAGLISAVGIDCWEGEPAISPELLKRALIATPHIAGYSLEGKIRATAMALDAFTAHFSLPQASLPVSRPAPAPEAVTPRQIDYDILADTRALKQAPQLFEHLRDTYALRPEPHAPQG